MSGWFDHFLLTRFNLRIEGGSPASETWLRHRLHLFKTVCVPSVRSQSVRSFRWLVLCDAASERWFVEEIERLAKVADFEPVFIDGAFRVESLQAIVSSRARSRWIITTRLDNDDAIACDFMERVQVAFDNQALSFVNFPSGIQMTSDGAVYSRVDQSNAFISLIEQRDQGVKTVFVDWHNRLGQYGPIQQQWRAGPMWIQMIHDKNLANVLRGIRRSPSIVNQRFSISLSAAPIGRLSLLRAQTLGAIGLAGYLLTNPSRFTTRVQALWRRGARTE